MTEVRAKTNGISYYMYNKDHDPPHVHVYFGNPRYPEQAAKIAIATQEILSGKLNGKRHREAAAWIAERKHELLKMWINRELDGGIYKIKD